MDARHAYEYHGARIAPVAQLDRVLPSEGRGRGFESRLVHHNVEMKKPQAVGSGVFLWVMIRLDKDYTCSRTRRTLSSCLEDKLLMTAPRTEADKPNAG